MNNEFIPYSQHVFDADELEAVLDVLRNGWIARGPKVPEFEAAVKKKYGYLSATACSSGSAALEIVLRSLNLQSNDEVIVPTITWAASASAVLLAGAKVVFADVDPSTINLTREHIEPLITPRTKAVIVVHIAGRPCDMDDIWELADTYSFHVIEDAAHAFGSSYMDGNAISSSNKTYASTFSFHPAKNITTAEGGLVVTQNLALDSTFKVLRAGGVLRDDQTQLSKAFYKVDSISSNYHMTEIQAVLGIQQLNCIDNFLLRRRHIASIYDQSIINPLVSLPPTCQESSWNLYIVQLPDATTRLRLFEYLQEQNIGCYFHYPPLHKFNDVYHTTQADLPNSLKYSERAISLPIGPHLSDNQAHYIAQAINLFR